MTLTTTQIIDAIKADPAYFEKCVNSRTAGHPTQNGSFYRMTGEAIKDGILCGMYTEYTHPNIAAGCLAYEVELEGVLGVVRLSPFNPDEHYVKLIDPKGVGKVSAEVDPTSMNLVGDLETTYYTVIILGPKDDGSGGFTLWTFHPGDPVRASEVPAEGNVGKTITIREAKKMGLTHAKVKQN